MYVYVCYTHVGVARSWRGNPNNVYVYYTLVSMPVDPLRSYSENRISMWQYFNVLAL